MSSVTLRVSLNVIAYSVLACVLVAAAVTAYHMMYPTNEQFMYNTYDRERVSKSLTRQIRNLTLDEYVNIMNSTQNLKTISLQELSGNLILGCDSGVQLRTRADVYKWAKQVAGRTIVECAKKQDWYRLAMILLKLFDSECAVDPHYVQWFERAPTNGLFGAEAVRMMRNNDVYPFWKLPPIPQLMNTPFTEKDDLFRDYISLVYTPFSKELNERVTCERGKDPSTRCDQLSIPLFCKLGCVMARDVFGSISSSLSA